MARVFGDIEDVWAALFKTMGNPPYPMPTVVLFSFGTSSACGLVRAEVGPIYCPADSQIYVDPDFLGELSRRTTALGDFAQAYLLSREVRHHVQNTLGTMPQFERSLSQVDDPRRIQLQVRRELQADCYTGVWAFLCPEAPSISSRRSRGRSAGCSKQLATSRRLALPHSKGGGSIGA